MNENKKPDVFGGFQALSDSLIGSGIPKDSEVIEVDDLKDILDATDDDTDNDTDDVVEDVKKEIKKPDKKVPPVVDDTDDEVDDDDTTDVEKVIKDNKKPVKTDDVDDLSEYESDITGVFQEKLAEELGWEFGEDEKFSSVKEMVDFMKNVVEESSKPMYASEEIERLNDFVTNGGKLEDFYTTVKPGGINPEVLDITSDADLKLAIREKLILQGYKDDRIKKMISRYEDGDILQDEGEDAVEFLKEYKIAEKEKLLENTRKNAEQVKIQQQKFYSTVESNIKSLEDIRGIKVSGRDKQDLLDYIFKPDSTGVTKYQRDYMSDVKNLIESAYFTKQGDKLINTAKQAGTSDAYKDLHQKLKANKGKRSSGASSQESSDSSESLTNLLGKHLLRK
jgi:hypothetical protein